MNRKKHTKENYLPTCYLQRSSSVLLFSFFIIYYPTFAQPSNFQFKKVENPNGIKVQEIHSIVQDSLGYLWLGGNKGLFRYDGTSFINYHKDNRKYNIPFDKVKVALGRKKGELLLIGKSKIALFDYLNNQFTFLKIPEIEGTPSIRLSSPIIDHSGGLWITAFHKTNENVRKHFVFYSNDFQEFELIKTFQQETPSRLKQGRNGILLYIKDKIVELNQGGDVIREFELEGNIPVDFQMDKKGVLWIKNKWTPNTSKADILYWEPGAISFQAFQGANNRSNRKTGFFWVDDDYILTANTFLHSLVIYNRKSGEFTQLGRAAFGYEAFWFSSIIKDLSGTYWLGGLNLYKMEPKSIINHYLVKGNNACRNQICNIKGLAEGENGNIYIGYIKNVSVLNPKTGELSLLNESLDEVAEPRKIHFFKEKILLDNLLFDPKTGNHKFLKSEDDHVAMSATDESGKLWLCVNGFAEIWIYEDFEKTPASITGISDHLPPNTYVEYNDILNSSDGNMWIATQSHGLFQLSPTGILLKHFELNLEEENSLLSRQTYCLSEDEEGNIWIGSGFGLSRLNPSEDQFLHFTNQEGLNGVKVFCMASQPGKGLWLGTDRGLSYFDFKSQSFLNFSQKDGLINEEYNRNAAVRSSDGRLYFGGLNGLDAFYPNDLLGNKGNTQLPIFVTRLSYFDGDQDEIITIHDELEQLQQIDLEAADKFFTLQFQLADYKLGAKTRYSYKLEGYDDWSRLSENNRLSYEYLPSGEYLLRIKASPDPGFWNDEELAIKVIKQQYWYKTKTAIAFFILLALSLIYALYQFQLKRRLEQQEAFRLRELDAVKTRLYTNITHEFRTPLTVIIGLIDNIWGFDKERNLIKRNSKNLLRLINQLLDLSKLDSGRMEMDAIQDDVINYLRYLTESFYSMAQERKITLTFSSQIEELNMDFDEVKLQHVIYNLLSNALKFTPEGGKVEFQTEQTTKNGQPMLKLKISDSGVGISPSKLPHIFDRFFQADNSTTRKGEGTGIGLSLTRELVNLMGGSITAHSEVKKGSTFLVWLPIQNKAPFGKLPAEVLERKKLEKEIVPPVLKKASNGNIAQPIPAANGESPILQIIEDNKDVAFYIRSILERDYQIYWSKDGEEGVEKALKIIPDIIISDIMMPKKDGYEVVELLKKDERTSHIPIILLTAKADFESKIKGLDYGADAYLAKPFRKEELQIRLKKLVELRKQLQKRYAAGLTFEKRQSSTNKKNELENAFLLKAVKFIEAHLSDGEFGNAELAKLMTMSESQLHRKLKALTGKSLAIFIRSVRLNKGKELLETTDLSVSEIAYDLGFSNPGYFTRTFSKEFGKAPSAVRE